jgi:formylglycine-generating enzyme required for sulfatase activity
VANIFVIIFGFFFIWPANANIHKKSLSNGSFKEKISYQINGVEIKLALIPSGYLIKKESQAYISPFYMMETEVTWQFYQVCIDENVCDDANDVDFNYGWNTPYRPVFNVSWMDVTEKFIPWINNKLGLNGAYSLKLPALNQWRYAATAGSASAYPWGNKVDCTLAQFDGGKQSQCPYRKLPYYRLRGPASVKSYAANQFGLHDMNGNVWEWTSNCSTKTSANHCKYRVITGGSWFDRAENITSLSKFQSLITLRDYVTGFRLIQTPIFSEIN